MLQWVAGEIAEWQLKLRGEGIFPLSFLLGSISITILGWYLDFSTSTCIVPISSSTFDVWQTPMNVRLPLTHDRGHKFRRGGGGGRFVLLLIVPHPSLPLPLTFDREIIANNNTWPLWEVKLWKLLETFNPWISKCFLDVDCHDWFAS